MRKIARFLHRKISYYGRYWFGYTATKRKLHKDFKKIQNGEILPANPRQMRVVSKMLKNNQYGTTSTQHDDLKLDLMASPARLIAHHHGKNKVSSKSKHR